MRITKGFDESQRPRVARLFWDAFSGKLGRIMAPERKAVAFIEASLRPDHAMAAFSESGAVLGVAGFKTPRAGLITAGFTDLRRAYGLVGALWRGPLLDLTERSLRDGELLLDGIFVAPEARGRGVGAALIEAIVAEARHRGMVEVRLDVIDTNPRARSLYERLGFEACGKERLGLLYWVFGFRSATTMRRKVLP